MTTIRIFDPAMCCESGVCGVDFDPALSRIAADIAWAREHGATIERMSLAREPQAFVDEPTVKRLLEQVGRAALPVTLVDGELTLSGHYPDRAQLARWTGLAAAGIEPAAPAVAEPVPAGTTAADAAGSCGCSGGRCAG